MYNTICQYIAVVKYRNKQKLSTIMMLVGTYKNTRYSSAFFVLSMYYGLYFIWVLGLLLQ